MTSHIIIHGNPVDGFGYVGPFEDATAAAEAGNHDPHLDPDWWIAPLEAPELAASDTEYRRRRNDLPRVP